MNLSFGNPNREFLPYLRETTYLDSLLDELKTYNPPGYEESRDEVASLIPLCDSIYSDSVQLERFLYYDSDFENYIVAALKKLGIPEEPIRETIKSIHDDTISLLLKLKFHFNRARPQQFAFYCDLPLYPYISKTANTPSYPSGHAFQSFLYCEVLGNRYPKYYTGLQSLAQDISSSRQHLGVHFPSDSQFAKYCADLVLNHPDFKRKYKL